ncbi:mediator complex subunit intersex [Rhipicephalus microplus]|uniref:mediator complex subunit intersex n=1 Tax=Rhipicephalus microplus TaxID=6941 RepID=UPI003F6D0005
MAAPMQGLPAGGSVPPGGPPNPSMPPQHPNQPQAGHSSQGQTSTTEVKFDNVAKVKALVWSLKDALSNLVRVAATNIYHTAAVDNGVRANTSDESAPPRLDKALEDFFSICNQIELNLRTIQECALQLRDSHQYLPVPVVATKPDPSNPQDGTLSYSQYINTIRAQVSFANTVHDVLNEGARRINQPE